MGLEKPDLFHLGEEELCAAIEEFGRRVRMETIFESSEDDMESSHLPPASSFDDDQCKSKDVVMVTAANSAPSTSSPRLLLHQSVQSWLESTKLPATLRVHVLDSSFELHELPLVSRSGFFKRVLTCGRTQTELGPDFPGGPDVFATVASFCYGATIMVEPGNVAPLRCAAEYLEMSDEFGKGNLCELSDMYLRKVALQSWEGSYAVIGSLDGLLPLAEELLIVSRCVDSLAFFACKRLLELDESRSEWWTQEVWVKELVELHYGFFNRVIAAVRRQGAREQHIGRMLVLFVERWVFGDPGLRECSKSEYVMWCQNLEQLSQRSDKCRLVESAVRLLPLEKHVLPVSFLFSFLRFALGVGASTECRAQLETRIASQLELASVEDLKCLRAKEGRSMSSKAHVESLRQIINMFMSQQRIKSTAKKVCQELFDQDEQLASAGFFNFEAVTRVAELWDAYLEELGYESGITPVTFSDLIELVPACARTSHDQLYKAVHVYLKAHPHVTHSERVSICKGLNCQKLSQEACIHAVQNELMPLRTIVQAMFMEQLQSRGGIPPAVCEAAGIDQDLKDIRVASNDRAAAPKRSSSHRFHPEQLYSAAVDTPSNKRRHDTPSVGHAVYVNHDFEAAKTRLKQLEKELALVKKTLQQSKCPGVEQLNYNQHRNGGSCIGQMLNSQRTGINLGNKLLKTFKRLGLGGLWKGKYNTCYDVSSSSATSNEEELGAGDCNGGCGTTKATAHPGSTTPSELGVGHRRKYHHRSYSIS